MKSFRIFAVFIIILSSCATVKTIQEDFHTDTYNARMASFEKNPLHASQVVFFGNSITQAGEWSRYFPEAKAVNRGISGDNTEGMLARIDEIVAAKPRKFFIMAGINDISLSRTKRVIVRNYAAIIRRLIKDSPETEIYIQSVLPINNDFGKYTRLKGKESQVLSLNRELRQLAESNNVTFIHLFPYFSDNEGKLKKEFTGDGLHLNADAYSLWVQIIRRFVE